MTTSQEERFHQRQPRYSKEEFARRGDEIYESQVRLPPVGFANGSIPLFVRRLTALTPSPSPKLGSGCNRAEVPSACVAPSRGDPEPAARAG
jgi:hypothetical protein